jgi:hypothetical protein
MAAIRRRVNGPDLATVQSNNEKLPTVQTLREKQSFPSAMHFPECQKSGTRGSQSSPSAGKNCTRGRWPSPSA